MKTLILFCSLLLLTASTPLWSSSPDQGDRKEQCRPALLVIDIQNAYLNSIPEHDREVAMTNINYYIGLFRSMGYPVIRIYHLSKEYGPQEGTDQFEFPASVSIKPDDPRIVKTYPDAFNKTGLDKVLKDRGTNTVFLCGLSAVGCVLATWIGAQNNDYKAFLVKDAIMSHNTEYTNNVEVMFDAVGYEVIDLILRNAAR